VKASEKLEAHMQIEKLREMLTLSTSMSPLIEVGYATISADSENVEYLQEQTEFCKTLLSRAMFLIHASQTTAAAAVALAEGLVK
jgi:hypothetical protein